MNVARARVNDQLNAVAGDDLADNAISSQTYLTAAWKWYQAACATAGVETWIRTITLYSLPMRSTNDVANEAWVTWQGCSDGVNQYNSPALPQDLIVPLSFWQRQSSPTPNSRTFSLMTQAQDGLPPYLNSCVYDWREDGVYFYASQQPQDLKIRYSAYRADLNINLAGAQIPMMMCEDAMGARVAYEFTSARKGVSDPVAIAMKGWADEALATTIRRSSRRKQRQNIQRRSFSGDGTGYGYAWPVPSN